ncbi:MAG: flavin reductase family protein [Salinarimonadaceae bacterium]|nr:MAG: flavin reductase family protein [Salinarimonadaceae bacterium]
MFYEVAKGHGLPFDPFKAVVAPRPIGWISAISAKGEVNLSPYSFFNAVSDNPHMVGFSSQGIKDAITFVEETGEFVCNLATWDLRDQMNASSAPLPRGQNEMDFAGLTAAPSRLVKPPRVAESPVAFECKLLRIIPLKPLEGEAVYHFVIGQVMAIHIDDRFIIDGIVDTAAMRPIARAGYKDYFVGTPETKFSLARPPGAGDLAPSS